MMKLGDSHYCTGQFLVAMPGMQDERFARSELKRKYLMADGVELDDVLLITWRAD